ncbi:Panacea domain-containing protein [Paenibacillus senegalensis]|uniref:Panacea domain-containing protein n=1 Tax=Paenibacillus senegalensis TaxID=1465766 RepID=UPI00028A2101|nr:type II toxin-antitoxin system antitoxin SocA domain-containing protein [Paenibacillus senegalensis]
MSDILRIAAAMTRIYEEVYGSISEVSDLTEMKMHKLLYFAQKNHYFNFGEWLFDDDFQGWVHGPVNKKIRTNFSYLDQDVEITLEEEYTIREVVHEYGKFSAGYLRNLSHEDDAYKNSRIGLMEDQAGDRTIAKDDIITDLSSHGRHFKSDERGVFN